MKGQTNMKLRISVPDEPSWKQVCDICFAHGQNWIDGQNYHLEYRSIMQQKPQTIIISDEKNIYCQSKTKPDDWSVARLQQFLEDGNALPKP